MSGSLLHLIGRDGRFSMCCIDNLGDAHEALEDCFDLIYFLAGGDMERIGAACKALKQPNPWSTECGEPVSPPMRSPRAAKVLGAKPAGGPGEG